MLSVLSQFSTVCLYHYLTFVHLARMTLMNAALRSNPEDVPETKSVLPHLQTLPAAQPQIYSSNLSQLPPNKELPLECTFQASPSVWREALAQVYLPRLMGSRVRCCRMQGSVQVTWQGMELGATRSPTGSG